MRIVGLLALFLLLPSYAYAALININTADAALLDTLPGIGPSKAAAIIDYRTLNGPFARIEDIQNVSGIGPSTYATIAPLITVGETVATSSASTTVPASSVSTSGGTATYVPPPSSLSISISGAEDAVLEVPLHLRAQVTAKGGAVDTSAQVAWSFGDGSSAAGSGVEKIYHYAGTYVITAIASNSLARARAEATVTATRASVRLLPVTGDGITVANDADSRLDLSGWQLRADTGTFRIPDGMTLLPKSSALFPFAITQLPIAFDATLVYPSGAIAAQVTQPTASSTATASPDPAPLAEQPQAPLVSYKSVQKVEPITSTRESVPTYEKAVVAPTASTELAAVGAAVPPVSAQAGEARSTGLFHSVWTLGLLGVVVLAGGAFILL